MEMPMSSLPTSLAALSLGGVMLLSTACATPSPTAASAPAANRANGSPVPAIIAPVERSSPVASASPVSALGPRVTGDVQAKNGATITLTDGTSFLTGDRTSVIVTHPGTPADLQPGQYVAITAQPQTDGTLLASIIAVFPESLRGVAIGQRPMDDGNLMTNATIDDARISSNDAGELTVSFPGQSAQVRTAPGAQILLREPGSLSDVQVGSRVVATVVDGVATSLSLQ
jgi:hypothetical protein